MHSRERCDMRAPCTLYFLHQKLSTTFLLKIDVRLFFADFKHCVNVNITQSVRFHMDFFSFSVAVTFEKSWNKMNTTIYDAFNAFLKEINASASTQTGPYSHTTINGNYDQVKLWDGRGYCYSPERKYYIWCDVAQYFQQVKPIATCKLFLARKFKWEII